MRLSTKKQSLKKLGQLIFQRFCTFTKIDEAYLLRSRKVFWEKIYYLHALNSPFFNSPMAEKNEVHETQIHVDGCRLPSSRDGMVGGAINHM